LFKPLSSDSADRGRSIIRVKPFLKVQKFAFILMGKLTKTNMENDCAFANLEDKYTFKLKKKRLLHWTLFTNRCLAPPNLRAIHS
jgi:hypothetical protein